jgi:hypothetical protein
VEPALAEAPRLWAQWLHHAHLLGAGARRGFGGASHAASAPRDPAFPGARRGPRSHLPRRGGIPDCRVVIRAVSEQRRRRLAADETSSGCDGVRKSLGLCFRALVSAVAWVSAELPRGIIASSRSLGSCASVVRSLALSVHRCDQLITPADPAVTSAGCQ